MDLIAGVTVGLVALPLAMAFGIASGVSPQGGIYTSVVAGFFISALGDLLWRGGRDFPHKLRVNRRGMELVGPRFSS